MTKAVFVMILHEIIVKACGKVLTDFIFNRLHSSLDRKHLIIRYIKSKNYIPFYRHKNKSLY